MHYYLLLFTSDIRFPDVIESQAKPSHLYFDFRNKIVVINVNFLNFIMIIIIRNCRSNSKFTVQWLTIIADEVRGKAKHQMNCCHKFFPLSRMF